MLENWLKPLDGDLFHHQNDKNKFGSNIQSYVDKLPNLKKTQLAIIGIGEAETNEVRKVLYDMTFPFSKIKIADLGNLRKEENAFITQLLKELIEGGVCPIIIGHEGKFTQAQFFAHHSSQPSVSLVEVKERIA